MSDYFDLLGVTLPVVLWFFGCVGAGLLAAQAIDDDRSLRLRVTFGCLAVLLIALSAPLIVLPIS